jgi:hypothetical protein
MAYCILTLNHICCCLPLQSNLKQYVENKYVTESTGFKALPEIINGRAAMIGECDTVAAEACRLFARPLVHHCFSRCPGAAVDAVSVKQLILQSSC